VLGETRQIDLDTGLLVLFSGNNMTVVGDMTRRVLNVRIDPACEAPAMRRFDFDPLREVRTNRDIMLAAALTLVRWGMSRPDRTKGRVGSFEMWDEVVGQTVAALRLEEFADPVDSLLGMRDADPRLEMTAGLLFALRDVFGSCWFKAADVMDMLNTRRKGHDIVQGVLDDSNVRPSVVSIGLFLRYRKDTRVEGLCLRMTSDSGKRGSRFRIESGEDSNVVGFDTWRANKAVVDAGKTDHIRPPK
jgi:putative DNA primase/helicase